MSVIRKEVYSVAEAHCEDCDIEWEDYAEDVGKAVYEHEEETGHEVVIDDEWEEQTTVNTRTGERLSTVRLE